MQSDIGDSFTSAKAMLEEGRTVLFSGVPCQIIALIKFLGKEYEKLYTVEIVCHGVPSPVVFQKYGEAMAEKFGSSLTQVDFRNKRKSWSQYEIHMSFANKKLYKKPFYKDPYCSAFIKNVTLRPSCYCCKANKTIRHGDLILGDYWGIYKIHPQFADRSGVSLVVSTNSKGQALLYLCSDSLMSIPTELDKAIQYNICMIRSVNPRATRTEFFENLYNREIIKLLKAASLPTVKEQIYRIKYNVKRIIKTIIHLFRKYSFGNHPVNFRIHQQKLKNFIKKTADNTKHRLNL